MLRENQSAPHSDELATVDSVTANGGNRRTLEAESRRSSASTEEDKGCVLNDKRIPKESLFDRIFSL